MGYDEDDIQDTHGLRARFFEFRVAACLKTAMPHVELGAGRVSNVARAARLTVNCH